MTIYDPGPEDMYPMLRADNAEVLIHPSDRKYGALLVGGQGTGKSSALLSLYLNDLEDPRAAPIVIDPKSELSHVCLDMTPHAPARGRAAAGAAAGRRGALGRWRGERGRPDRHPPRR